MSRRRSRVAAGLPAATLTFALVVALGACQTMPPPPANTAARLAAEQRLRETIASGISLYESGEFVVAARRFTEAAHQAHALRDWPRRKDAITSECMSWMRARRLGELAECTARLEPLQRRERRSEPGVNTLIAFGAIAGKRPLPALKIPTSVRPLVQASAQESR